jgi:alpha-methylacyl-CoA racemase
MSEHGDVLPLREIRVVTLALNVPGPVAAARLRELGASVTKIEPPYGDPLEAVSPAWYHELRAGQEVARIDLKQTEGRVALDDLLGLADVLLTASRPAALARLGLTWPRLHERFPRLAWVAIIGQAAPHADAPGHDLTYVASLGLLDPPKLPRTLLADLAGAERAVSAALTLLYARERGQDAGYAKVSLAEAARSFAEPLRHGLTRPGGGLNGGLPAYNIYRTKDGWIAVAALEPHFRERLRRELGLDRLDTDALRHAFRQHSGLYWEAWGLERDLPVAALRE